MKKIPLESTEVFQNRTLNTEKLKIGLMFDETIPSHDFEPTETWVSQVTVENTLKFFSNDNV